MRRMMVLGAAVSLLNASAALAQTNTAVALALGGSYNVHTGSALQQTATGVGFVGGGQIDLTFSKSLGLLTTLYAYDNRIGKYTYTQSQNSIDYSFDVSVTLAYAGIEPLVKFIMPDDRFYFVAGPNIGFMVQGQSEINATITTPGYTFSNGYASQSSTADLTDVNTRFEFTLGGGYVFKIDKISRLTTQLSVAYGLNSVQKNVDWRISSVRLIGGLEFDIFQ